MPRVKNGTIHRARRKKILKQAKGYFGSKHRLYKTAKEQVMHSLSYAYRDRRQKKRDFRKLWIVRINAGCRENDISYSRFINGLMKSGVEVNRKMLSEIAIHDPKAFTEIVNVAKAGLEGKVVTPKVVEIKKETVKKEVKETVKETVKKEIKETVKEDAKDYSKLTVAELREMAKIQNIVGYSAMKKADLLAVIK